MGRPWIVLFGTNKLASVDPESLALTEHVLPRAEQFVNSAPVPSGGGAIRHVDYDPKAGRIWFGTDVNTIG